MDKKDGYENKKQASNRRITKRPIGTVVPNTQLMQYLLRGILTAAAATTTAAASFTTTSCRCCCRRSSLIPKSWLSRCGHRSRRDAHIRRSVGWWWTSGGCRRVIIVVAGAAGTTRGHSNRVGSFLLRNAVQKFQVGLFGRFQGIQSSSKLVNDEQRSKQKHKEQDEMSSTNNI